MSLSNPSSCVRPLVAAIAMLFAASLAGCVADDIAADDTIMPYGGSKTHPIKVVNGKATVEPCGIWTKDVADASENGMSPNHGCAVQANIAAMTAYPNDLVKLRRMSPSPAYKGVAAITTLQTPASSSSASAGTTASTGTGGKTP